MSENQDSRGTLWRTTTLEDGTEQKVYINGNNLDVYENDELVRSVEIDLTHQDGPVELDFDPFTVDENQEAES